MRIDEWKVKFMERSKKIGMVLLNFVGSLELWIGDLCVKSWLKMKFVEGGKELMIVWRIWGMKIADWGSVYGELIENEKMINEI